MKSLKFLATAAIVSAFALTSCVQDVLETGIDTSKPGVTNLTYGEVAHGSKTMTLYWSGAEAVNAGATSFSVQFLENKDTLGGKLLKPDMYDPSISKTVEIVKDEDGLVSTTDFSAQMEGQTVGNKYYIRVRANYPMSIYSDWTWLTDAQGNIAYFKVGRGIITEGIEDPYLFKVTGTSTGLIVKWDAIPDATSYQVEYKKSSESSWISETVPAGADLPTILKIKNLPSETSYDVRAKTITPAGDSEYCDVQTVSTRKPGSFPKSMKDAKELIDWLEGGVVEVEPSDVFTLAADIDLTGQTFTAMDESLLGTFDGANHTIKGVSSTLLYDIESTGTVKNLTIEGTMNSSDENFAGLALSNKGTITDVEVKANINYDAALSSLMKVGGIVADNTGTLKKVTYSGTLAATSSQNVAGPIVIGGLAAYSAGTIEDSHNKGPVSFKTANYIQGMAVAGLVGYLENAITGSDNSGAIAIEAANAVAKAALINTSSATPTVAGIAGYGNTDAFAITDCTNDGLVSYTLKTIDLQKDGKTTASANYNRTQVGGIVGNPYGKVTRAINNGTISINMGTSTGEVFTGSNHEHIICAGGIGGGDFFAGADQNKTSYIDCVNNGKINAFVGSAQSNSAIGGIVGWPGKEGSRTNSTSGCKNTGNITLTGPGKVRCGGIHGGSGIITNCENSGNIVANDGTACSLGGLAGFSSNGFKITGSRSTGNVTGNVSGFNVGGLLGNIGNSAGSGGFTGCSVSATVKAADPDQATSGMIIGYYNGTSAATSAGTAASPVLVNGIYNGTKLTAGNFSNYLEGKNNKADVHEMYAKFDETPYESEGEEPVTPALESPQNVKVEVFYDYTTISWDAVNGAEWYVVEYKKSGTDNWVPCEKTENTTYTIEGLDHGSSYSFRVKAYTSTGSGYSDEASAETYEEVNLGAPVYSSISATATEITVSWQAAANATGYVIAYKKATDSDLIIAKANVSELSYKISGLDPETAYEVFLKTLGQGGNESAWSAAIPVSTTELKKVKTPTDIVAAPKFEAVTLTFPALKGASSFEVYSGSTKLESTVISAEGAEKTVLRVSGLKTGESYSLKVKAFSSDPEIEASDLSAAVTAKTAEIKVIANSPTDVVIEWTDVQSAHKYDIGLADASGNQIGSTYTITVGKSTIPTGTSVQLPCRFQYPALQPNTPYKLLVKENGDEKFTAFDVTTAAKHTAGSKEVFFQGFDDAIWAGDCRTLGYSLMSKAAATIEVVDWPVTTDWLWSNENSATISPGAATRSSAIFTYATADPECSFYGYAQEGVEMHNGYLKVGSGSVIGYIQTAELGTSKLSADSETSCTITAKVCPRSDATASTAKINFVVVHSDGTETIALQNFDVVTNGDSYNFTWKEAKATGVKLRSTDKLKIIAATETASGAWRFHLDDILIVAE